MDATLDYKGPYIDERVEHVGVSRLRSLNATNLKHFEKTLVIQDNDKPLVVLLPYEQFLAMQKQLVGVLKTLELFNNAPAKSEILTGLQDAQSGKMVEAGEFHRSLTTEQK